MTERKRRFYHGVRFRLFLVSLTLVVIPWAGYRYIEETEAFLRRGQESVLLGTAQTVATVLHNRRDLFRRDIQLQETLSGPDGLYVHRLETPIQLDGYTDDWTALLDRAQHFGPEHRLQGQEDPSSEGLSFDYLAGFYRGYLYVLLQVRDDRVIYRGVNSRRLDRSDYLEIVLERTDQTLSRYLLATFGPGWVSAYEMPDDPAQPYPVRPEVRIKGEWQEAPEGYTLEFRIPESLLGHRLALAVGDVDDPESRDLKSLVATSGTRRLDELGILVTPSPAIQRLIDSLEHDSARIWVIDHEGRVLALKGQLQAQGTAKEAPEEGLGLRPILQALYRLVLPSPLTAPDPDAPAASRLQGPEVAAALAGRAEAHRHPGEGGQGAILSAAYPIHVDGEVLGAVVVEQSTNAILSIQNQALERLFTVTLVFFAGTSLALLGFASRLASRIRRLRNRLDAAVAPDGRILGRMRPGRARDEIGDLERGFEGVLRRLAEYNRYLESMASRLAHEFRTPLTVIKTSLENLEMEHSGSGSRRYLHRAMEGADRLSRILNRLREATRLEQMLEHTERETFDLCGLILAAVEIYGGTYPDTRFVTRTPPDPVPLEGAPELVGQALDNLVGNAVDFHTEGSPITLRIGYWSDDTVKLSVCNQGRALPQTMRGELFESMVSLRDGEDSEPHLGLGLYLVRLIAEFHRGRAFATNLEDGSGVEIGLILPLKPD